jgi:hypothetical protein
MLGPGPLSILLWGAPPIGVDDQSGPHPCPTRPRRRRLGLSLSRDSQPTLAPATRNTTHNHPGHQLASARATLYTVPATRVTRHTRLGRDRGHGPCTGWMHVGHGQRGAHHTIRPPARADATTHSEGVPRCIGRAAAPVWCHPRRRSEAATGHASRDRGRHPTDASQVGANPRRAAGSTVAYGWLRLCRCTKDTNIMKTDKIC